MAKSVGKPPHEPTKATRELVKMHTMVGTPQSLVADILDIDDKTLRKYYRRELDLAKHQANAQVGGALFNKAVKGDTAAAIFWLKTQAGFRESKEDFSNEPAQPLNVTFQVRNAVDEITVTNAKPK